MRLAGPLPGPAPRARRRRRRPPPRPPTLPSRPPAQDPRLVANLRAIAEAAKIKLSTEESVMIRMPVGGGIEAVLTRQARGGRGGGRRGGPVAVGSVG